MVLPNTQGRLTTKIGHSGYANKQFYAGSQAVVEGILDYTGDWGCNSTTGGPDELQKDGSNGCARMSSIQLRRLLRQLQGELQLLSSPADDQRHLVAIGVIHLTM